MNDPAIDEVKSRFLSTVIQRETGGRPNGGYTNDPIDKGGETKWGITAAVWQAEGFTGRVLDRTQQEAVAVYSRRFWDRPQIGEIAKRSITLAEYMADYGVHSGPARPTRDLQGILNIMNDRGRLYPDLTEDGQTGPATLRALDSYLRTRGARALEGLNAGVNAKRIDYCFSIAERNSSQERFSWGWLLRVLDLITDVQKAAPVPLSWLQEVDTK